MKLTALAVVILALGIVAGFALAEGSSGGPASAAPQCPGPSSQCPTPPPQQREDQIVIFTAASESLAGGAGLDFELLGDEHISVQLDSADYPADNTFRLEVSIDLLANSTSCFRLLDKTASSPVSASEFCISSGTTDLSASYRSSVFGLSSEPREYGIEEHGTQGFLATVRAARIIAEWTE